MMSMPARYWAPIAAAWCAILVLVPLQLTLPRYGPAWFVFAGLEFLLVLAIVHVAKKAGWRDGYQAGIQKAIAELDGQRAAAEARAEQLRAEIAAGSEQLRRTYDDIARLLDFPRSDA